MGISNAIGAIQQRQQEAQNAQGMIPPQSLAALRGAALSPLRGGAPGGGPGQGPEQLTAALMARNPGQGAGIPGYRYPGAIPGAMPGVRPAMSGAPPLTPQQVSTAFSTGLPGL